MNGPLMNAIKSFKLVTFSILSVVNLLTRNFSKMLRLTCCEMLLRHFKGRQLNRFSAEQYFSFAYLPGHVLSVQNAYFVIFREKDTLAFFILNTSTFNLTSVLFTTMVTDSCFCEFVKIKFLSCWQAFIIVVWSHNLRTNRILLSVAVPIH